MGPDAMTQFSWVLRKDPILLGQPSNGSQTQDNRIMMPNPLPWDLKPDQSELGPLSRPNSLEFWYQDPSLGSV